MRPETRHVACPVCHARPGRGCRTWDRRRNATRPHLARLEAYLKRLGTAA